MAEKVFTRAQVSASDKKNANIFIIYDDVYDVKTFLEDHPGGHEVLENAANCDATEMFEDIGHSVDAKTLMAKYKIGVLTPAERTERKSNSRHTDGSKLEEQSDGFSWYTPLIFGALATALYFYLFV